MRTNIQPRYRFGDEREQFVLLIWNGGCPLLIDGTQKFLTTSQVDSTFSKTDLLKWAALNQVRCVGFEGDSRPPRRSFHTSSWAVVD